MKYVITGSAGHISKPLAQKLLQAGHQVTVIGRNAANLKELVDLGARLAIGSVEDVDFLVKAFAGADAAYCMIPPKFDVSDWKTFIGQIGQNYTKAIAANNLRHAVLLSSVGADMADGAGPVSGLYRAEQSLNTLKQVNLLHLRPGYFFQNLLSNVNMVKNMNIMGSNFGGHGFKLVMADPEDIAAVAAEELLNLKFTGHSVRYIASDERTTDDIARVLGAGVGKPGLQWMVFTDEQALEGILQAGLPREIAENFTEMGHALRSGKMSEDYWRHHPGRLEKTKLEDFAKTFAAVYQQEAAPVHS